MKKILTLLTLVVSFTSCKQLKDPLPEKEKFNTEDVKMVIALVNQGDGQYHFINTADSTEVFELSAIQMNQLATYESDSIQFVSMGFYVISIMLMIFGTLTLFYKVGDNFIAK